MKRFLLLASLALMANTTFAQDSDDYDDEDDEDFGWSDESSDEDDLVVRLKGDEFYEQTAGKRVFLEFYDPMCGHCVMMAEDWARLADENEDDEDVLIGKVDCTKDINKLLCKDYGVTGYPTLLYGDVIDLKEYKGGRELGEFREVVEDHLEKPICGVANPGLCDEEQKQAIEDLISQGLEKLDKEIKDYEDTVLKFEKKKDEAVGELRNKYSKELKRKDQEKDALEESSNMPLMRQILQMKEDGVIPEGKESSRDEL